ncbi:hypothetical protein [Tahibacter harae]|uniref:MSHA biogenesis protein MshK n=1 Tax=Tahibacter harae TaxID=2963937 RepID=A0ABT1QUI8_9GAMM|nr:hypothetical protein [Tahibacter harae]MCQ4165950.1 hypothetical protein [Tahibacter harae]
MRAVMLSMLSLAALPALAAGPDEARIEQLLAAKPEAAAPAAKGKPARGKAAETDSAASLVGQRVVVETRSQGVYLGTLTAVSRDALTLAIELPARSVSYTLPRANVARIAPR